MKLFNLLYGVFYIIMAFAILVYDFNPEKEFVAITMIIAALSFFKLYMQADE